MKKTHPFADPEFAREFVAWHESRMAVLCYPPEIRTELRRVRHKFMPAATRALSLQAVPVDPPPAE